MGYQFVGLLLLFSLSIFGAWINNFDEVILENRFCYCGTKLERKPIGKKLPMCVV